MPTAVPNAHKCCKKYLEILDTKYCFRYIVSQKTVPP